MTLIATFECAAKRSADFPGRRKFPSSKLQPRSVGPGE